MILRTHTIWSLSNQHHPSVLHPFTGIFSTTAATMWNLARPPPWPNFSTDSSSSSCHLLHQQYNSPPTRQFTKRKSNNDQNPNNIFYPTINHAKNCHRTRQKSNEPSFPSLVHHPTDPINYSLPPRHPEETTNLHKHNTNISYESQNNKKSNNIITKKTTKNLSPHHCTHFVPLHPHLPLLAPNHLVNPSTPSSVGPQDKKYLFLNLEKL